ncbi:hypothetical protein V6N12_050276 [Hibiscus sabdariffa]|uniref:Uncharacterized protein n=1 Tax=Hibiscus sabdariffa TaxID=183260 RepID=A0ABR2GD28_9ROSI
MVQPRRRGFSNSTRKASLGTSYTGQQIGFHFAVLDTKNLMDGWDAIVTADGSGNTGRTAPDRDVQSNRTGNMDINIGGLGSVGSVEVMPSVDGIDLTIVAHTPIVSSRDKGFAQKGFRIKKPVINAKGGVGVVEWVKSAHALIDAVGRQSDVEPGEPSTAMDDSHNGFQVSDDEEL